MIKLLILSDTHLINNAVPESVRNLAGLADQVIHAGDFCNQAAYDAINNMCKNGQLLAVKGHEKDDEKIETWNDGILPNENHFEYEGVRIGLVHGHLLEGAFDFKRAIESATIKAASFTIPENPAVRGVQVLVLGHIHYPFIANSKDRMLICPGSPTDPRHGSAASVAWLEIDQGNIRANIICFGSHTDEYMLNARRFNILGQTELT
jgi:putative phosphoesterase